MKKLFLFLMIAAFMTGIYAQDWLEEVPYGTEYTVTAEPNEGWEFVNWTEDGVVVSTEPSYTFIVTGERDLVANFRRLMYEINVTVNPPNSGFVEGSGEFPPGHEVILDARPNKNWNFRNFENKQTGDIYTENPLQMEAVENAEIVANFYRAGIGYPWNILIIAGLIVLIFLAYKGVELLWITHDIGKQLKK